MTRLEDLSDELFLEIFSFIGIKDLYQGWYHLNEHINRILRSVSVSIQIKNNDDFDDLFPFLQYFYSQIIYLKDERYLPDIEIDVRLLINIRSLYLIQYSNNQYELIDPNIQSRLTRFYSLSAPWSFYERILFGEKRFPYLISIGCPRGASILLFNLLNSINRTIVHLHLYSVSNEILYKYFEYFPNLLSLTIEHFYPNSLSSIPSLINSSIHHLTIIHSLTSQSYFDQLLWSLGFSQLINVNVSFKTCDFEQLSNILRKCSSLKHLIVRVDTFPTNIDLISIRLINPWFLSLDYQYIIEHKQILLINTIRKAINSLSDYENIF